MSSSEEDEDAEDDADVLSQFKINTKGHKQKYLSLNKSEKDKREKVSDGDASASDEDSPCLLYTSPSPRDLSTSRMPSSA